MGTAEDVRSTYRDFRRKMMRMRYLEKGSLTIYVNGRLLRDLSELDQLKSEDNKNVELITSPVQDMMRL